MWVNTNLYIYVFNIIEDDKIVKSKLGNAWSWS